MSLICEKLTTSEWITLISCIAASVSAIFAAVSAFLLWRQGASKIKITVSNDSTTEHPQNIFINEEHIAIIRVDVQNLSSHPFVLSDCIMKFDNEQYVALEKDMNFDFDKTYETVSPNGTSKKFTKPEHYARFPIELRPYQFAKLFIPFPNFKNTNANILCGTVEFVYNINKKIVKEITIHKSSVVRKLHKEA